VKKSFVLGTKDRPKRHEALFGDLDYMLRLDICDNEKEVFLWNKYLLLSFSIIPQDERNLTINVL
jgi:hypothetical protein